MACRYTINGAVAGFGPLIVSTFGYTPLESILLQFPLGTLCFISILVSGYLSTRFKNVMIPILLLNTGPVIAGCITIWKSSWEPPRPVGPVIGYTLIGTFGAVVSQIIVLGMSNVAGQTKKSIMAAAIFVAYCVGNIVGPQLIKSETKAQHYPELWTGLIICYCITVAATLALWFVMWKENRTRDAHAQRAGQSYNDDERDKLAFQDLTDKQNPYFRYVW
ncbi:hypothetical protein EJ05DRAFT_477399 [Pseudovirgaria hyperparasitica]|uniref:MFS general substrate transporter n=1 Tax=Pseudovirgaria hyperparasitica TaxID=470096 RepID=A0A6A6W2V0_9PEZI|nr:uncharacterized protein EJ05DRAFT_477399 [Pseudovirgaria hyperparasitica]KAF2757182.1 hypothetical protein EJ05DRAFT_477399 [Pseudovirgaria hyperparasitica]